MTGLIIDSYRRAEETPGQAHRPAWLHVNDGTHGTGATVLVSHHDIEFAGLVADAINDVLPDATQAMAKARRAYVEAEERTRKECSARLDAEDRLDAVLHGHRRLFGEALVRVSDDGSAWLLDPVKQESGFGLRYPSLADLWRAHPELRPVRWEGGDLIVDASIALADSPPQTHPRDTVGRVTSGSA
jgi:hypothetical protein